MATTNSAKATPSAAPEDVKETFYLPTLDILRFFAFFSIFLIHTTPVNLLDVMPASPSAVQVWSRIHASFGYGVPVFYVLSAFLITTLLLREKETLGSVAVGRFYFRRVLRIWPVFFLALALGALIIPVIRGRAPDWIWFGLLATFFGNYFYGFPQSQQPPFGASPLWSICVEEQFYLVWPWVARFLSRESLEKLCLFILIGMPAYRFLWAIHGIKDADIWFKSVTHLDCFAAGGLVALHWDHPLGKKLAQKGGWVLLLCVLVLFAQGLFAPLPGMTNLTLGPLEAASYSLVALSSLFIVWTVSHMTPPWNPGTYRFLVTGGKMSYSLYALHGCAVELGWNYFGHSPWYERLAFDAVLTIILASFSYFYLEKWFLKLKNRFQLVKSGPTDVPMPALS